MRVHAHRAKLDVSCAIMEIVPWIAVTAPRNRITTPRVRMILAIHQMMILISRRKESVLHVMTIAALVRLLQTAAPRAKPLTISTKGLMALLV